MNEVEFGSLKGSDARFNFGKIENTVYKMQEVVGAEMDVIEELIMLCVPTFRWVCLFVRYSICFGF